MNYSITQMVYPHILSENETSWMEKNQLNDVFLKQWRSIHDNLTNVERSYVWLFIEKNNHQERITYQSLELSFEKWLEAQLAPETAIEVLVVPFEKKSLTEFTIKLQESLHRMDKEYEENEILAFLPKKMPVIHTQLLLVNHQLFANRFSNLFLEDGQLRKINPYTGNTSSLWLRNFRSFIFDYDYIAALEITKVLSDCQIKTNIQHFLKMMINRYNFSFEKAHDHLQNILLHVEKTDVLLATEKLLLLLTGNKEQHKEAARIQELTRHMETMMTGNDIFSFLVRFYRLREAVLFYLFRYAEEAGYVSFDPQDHKSIYDRYEELEELYGLHDIDKYFGSYFFIKSNNVNQAILYRNRSFIGHNRQPIDRESFWRAYAGNERTSLKKAKLKFQNDLSVLLKDLGLRKDQNIDELNEWILTYARRLEAGDGTDTNHRFSS